MIERLQGGATQAVEAMEHSRQQAQLTREQSAKSSAVMAHITGAVSSISDMNAQIAAAAEQQAAVANEVNRGIVSINEVAEQAALGTQASERTSGDLERFSEALLATAATFKV